MDRHSDDWANRECDPADRRLFLINAVASASSYTKEGRFVLNISWVRMPDNWFAAWTSAFDGTGRYRRAPRLDAVDRADLGKLIGEVITPDCLNYGENGVLDHDPKDTPVPADHKCDATKDLDYEGEYGAPGYGQAWVCRVCAAPWSKVGNTFFQNSPDDGEPFNILTISDVR